MKITKRRLQQIIKEEVADILDAEHPSEVEAIEDVWSGDLEGESKNLALDIDHPKAAGAEETTKEPEMLPRQEDLVGESKRVRITKRQLRRLVREAMSQYGNDDRVENHPKRDELMDVLHKKYGLRSRTTEEFGTSPGGIWINAESNVPETPDGLPLFDYYLNSDPYTFGIHPDFEAFVIDGYGFAPEWNDPGTLMLWSLD